MRANTIVLTDANNEVSGNLANGLVFGPLELTQIFGYSLQANYTGSPAGTLKLQASNDKTNWCDIPGTSEVVASAGSFLWNVSSSNYLYVQIVWTPSGGSSGSLSSLAYIRGF